MKTIVNIPLMAGVFCIAGTASAASFKMQHHKVINSIVRAADKVEISRKWLLAVCWQESSFRTAGVSKLDGHTKSYGICQVKYETAQFMDKVFKHKVLVTKANLEDTYVNAFYAAKYLKYQLKRYKGDWKLAADAYNKGNAVSKNTKYVCQLIKSYEHISKNITADIKK